MVSKGTEPLRVGSSLPLAAATGITDAKAITSGQGHVCALLNGGTIKCWGAGGQTGDGTTTQRTTPVSTGITNGVSIAAFYRFTCAALADGSVKCWGTGFGNSPVTIAGISGAVEVATGYSGASYSLCARISDGTIKCIGSNNRGQLGDGTTIDRTSPVTVVGITNAVKLRMGGSGNTSANIGACSQLATGELKCWGGNDWGELGDGTAGAFMAPLAVGPWQ